MKNFVLSVFILFAAFSAKASVSVQPGASGSGGGITNVAWGSINGALSSQSDLNTAITAKANKAGDVFTGNVSFSGASTRFTIPNLTTAQKNAITPSAGDMLFDTDLGRFQAYDGAAWHSRVRLDGDSMTGPLFVTALTNSSLTASRAMVSGVDKSEASSATTAAELAFVSGVTSSIQTQLNGKQASGNYITSLTGDVTASGPGSAAATLTGDPHWTNGWDRVYNVKQFGATGNGSTDDTIPIQLAETAADTAGGGTVYFPIGSYKTTATIIVGATNGSHSVNLKGESETASKISYRGPTNSAAITLRSDKFVYIEDLNIQNDSGAQGSTVGLLLSGLGSGTRSNGGMVSRLNFTGFYIGIDTGPGQFFPDTGTSSEWIFDDVTVQSGAIGFYNANLNGLNFQLRMFQGFQLGIAVDAQAPGVTIDGGSFSFCTNVFFGANNGVNAIRDVRAEEQLGAFADTSAPLIIENCFVLASGSATNVLVNVTGRNTIIRGSLFLGHIVASNFTSLDIEDSCISDSVVANVTGSNGPVTFLRNRKIDVITGGNLGFFNDQFTLAGQPPSRAVVLNSLTNLVASATTSAEIALLSGAQSPVHSGPVGDWLTNSAGVIQGAIVAGANVSFSTNSGRVTITASGGFGTNNFSNPTGLVGLTAVSGAGVTAIRSDGAPALDQSIAPTWTGQHTFHGATLAGASTPQLDISQTWNNAGTTFTALRVNITNTAAGGSSLITDLQVGNTSMFSVRKDGVVATASTIRMNNSAANISSSGYQIGGDTIIERDSAATWQLGDDAASPVNQALKAHDATGADHNGASLTLEGGQSTGTGVGGAVDIATSLAAESTGSTANSYSIRYHAKGKYVALTPATATTIETFSLPANKILGGEMVATCYVTNSTPHSQSLTAILVFDAVAIGTTISGSVTNIATVNVAAADSGTLTCLYSFLDNGNNTFSIQANAVSSLTSPIERCKVVVAGMSGTAATTITDP